ncbi:hypothetical protein GCM10022200_06270 [Microbacterium awajiense]|uniref:DUF2017 domain-containing protein n=1 Tax=Microbacterium awajiense TaxID=415214 RepID=A0ABP7A816_9MICO
MTGSPVVIDLARVEAAHLDALVAQFVEVLDATGSTAGTDPAVARLVPDAYRDDADAAAEFRSLTEADLLGRRREDAASVRASLRGLTDLPDDVGDPTLAEVMIVELDFDQAQAWLRTLAAIRLVLASRLGIVEEDSHDEDDPRFAIYDWLGYRLQSLVETMEH